MVLSPNWIVPDIKMTFRELSGAAIGGALTGMSAGHPKCSVNLSAVVKLSYELGGGCNGFTRLGQLGCGQTPISCFARVGTQDVHVSLEMYFKVSALFGVGNLAKLM